MRRWEAKDEPLPLPVSNLIHLAKGLNLPQTSLPSRSFPRALDDYLLQFGNLPPQPGNRLLQLGDSICRHVRLLDHGGLPRERLLGSPNGKGGPKLPPSARKGNYSLN